MARSSVDRPYETRACLVPAYKSWTSMTDELADHGICSLRTLCVWAQQSRFGQGLPWRFRATTTEYMPQLEKRRGRRGGNPFNSVTFVMPADPQTRAAASAPVPAVGSHRSMAAGQAGMDALPWLGAARDRRNTVLRAAALGA